MAGVARLPAMGARAGILCDVTTVAQPPPRPRDGLALLGYDTRWRLTETSMRDVSPQLAR